MTKDSSLEKWEYREHTRVKHILLEKYLAAWITILGSSNRIICYFDCFAGRGEYVDGAEGSPIKVLKVADEKADYFDKFICFLIEKDKENFENLEYVLEREKKTIQNLDKIKIISINDEFSGVIEQLFCDIEEKNYILRPSFFFIDPFGFSGIPFDAIIKILENSKTEIFFTFMIRDISRFIGIDNISSNFNELFGGDEWENFVRTENREIALIELYRKKLHEIANVEYSLNFRVCESERLKTLYYLIHATNNYKGHHIMKSVMYHECSLGSFAYLGPDDIFERSQIKLFDICNLEELKKYLIGKFLGQTLTFDEIQEKICHPWYSEPPYLEKDYRKALKKLEKEERIVVERITSKKFGLREFDIISFPEG